MAEQVTIIDNFKLLELLSDEWEDLWNRSVTKTTFQTPAFILSWLKTLGENAQLKVITLRNPANQLVGMAPFYLTADNTIEFIGGKDVSDYLDFLVDRNYQTEVYQQIGQILFDWQIAKVNLFSLPAASPTLKLLPQIWSQLTSKSSNVIHAVQDVCPNITLPPTWEEYLAQIERKQRHEIRRKWKKLESLAEVEFVTISDLPDIDWATEEFIRLHKLSSKDKAKFWIPGMADFFHNLMLALAKKEELRLTFLKLRHLSVDAELDNPVNPIVATMFGFISNNKYLLYNSGFDPDYATLSTGQVLTSYTIKTAIEEMLTEYDFMRGREEYKFRLGGQPTEVFDLTLTR